MSELIANSLVRIYWLQVCRFQAGHAVLVFWFGDPPGCGEPVIYAGKIFYFLSLRWHSVSDKVLTGLRHLQGRFPTNRALRAGLWTVYYRRQDGHFSAALAVEVPDATTSLWPLHSSWRRHLGLSGGLHSGDKITGACIGRGGSSRRWLSLLG